MKGAFKKSDAVLVAASAGLFAVVSGAVLCARRRAPELELLRAEEGVKLELIRLELDALLDILPGCVGRHGLLLEGDGCPDSLGVRVYLSDPGLDHPPDRALGEGLVMLESSVIGLELLGCGFLFLCLHVHELRMTPADVVPRQGLSHAIRQAHGGSRGMAVPAVHLVSESHQHISTSWKKGGGA